MVGSDESLLGTHTPPPVIATPNIRGIYLLRLRGMLIQIMMLGMLRMLRMIIIIKMLI